jgi:phosphohistidine phosphatase SixA
MAAIAIVAGDARAADPELARQLQSGGLVLAIRHAATDFSKPDQDPVVLTDCRTQRNLSAQGRAEARAIGRGVHRLRLRIATVLSSPFCRTKETAQLAFGRAAVSRALLNTVNSVHNARWQKQIREARRLLGRRPVAGSLTILVTHGSVVEDATGQTLEEGETLVFRPRGNGRFTLIGRILARDWRTLRAAS